MTTDVENKPDAILTIDRNELVRQLCGLYLERYGARAMLEMFMEHLGCDECGCDVINTLYPREEYLRQRKHTEPAPEQAS